MAMVVPEEFNALCRHFHQDVMLIYLTPEDMIASALRSLDEKQKGIVRQFLDILLDGQCSIDEMKRLWRETPADIYFIYDDDLTLFLQSLRSAI